jgi:exodeoxyribonuclease X
VLIRVCDFESTGLPEDEGGAAVCEGAWCDLTTHPIEVGEPKSMVVNPGRPIRPEIRAVHHITDREIAGAPPPERLFETLMLGLPDYYAAHNANFEKAFFNPPSSKWLCTYRVALRLWPDGPPSYSNQVLRYWLKLELPDESLAMPPHRAGPDAYVTAFILARAIETGAASLDDMVRWSSGPPLLSTVTFGKHRGTKWKDLPDDYLTWLAYKSDMDADTKSNARYHIRVRENAAKQKEMVV